MNGEDDFCDVPPPGWYCTREKGHEGPCAAWPAKRYTTRERLWAEIVHLLYRSGLRSFCMHCDRPVWSRHFRRCNCANRRAQFEPLLTAALHKHSGTWEQSLCAGTWTDKDAGIYDGGFGGQTFEGPEEPDETEGSS